jgi:hypothetical protein
MRLGGVDMLRDAVNGLWNLATSLMGIQIQVFELKISIWNMFAYFTGLYLIFRLFYGLASRRSD